MFLQYSLPQMSEEFNVWVYPYITPYSFPIIHISLTGSVYSVVAVALERFITVCFPFTQCNMCGGLGYIIPIVLFSIFYNFIKFFELTTDLIEHEEWILHDNGTNISTSTWYPFVNATTLRSDPVYKEYVVFVLNFVMMGIRLILIFFMAVFMFDLFRADPSLVVVNSELYDLQINIKSYSHPQQHIILPQVSEESNNSYK